MILKAHAFAQARCWSENNSMSYFIARNQRSTLWRNSWWWCFAIRLIVNSKHLWDWGKYILWRNI